MLHFVKKWRIEICFVVEKINKNKNTKKRLQESTNKELHKKKEIAFPISFRKRYVLEKMLQKKESKGEKKGNTTLIEYAIWFFTKLCAKTNKYEISAQQKDKETNMFFRFATVPSTCLSERLLTERTKEGKGKQMY